MKTKAGLFVIFMIYFTGIEAQQLSLNWANQIGSYGWDYSRDIVHNSNGFLIGGSIKGFVQADTNYIISSQNSNAWLAQYDSSGVLQWQKTFGGKRFDNVTSLAVIPQGTLVAGTFQDTLLFGSQVLASDAQTSGYTGLIDSSGNPVWLNKVCDNASISDLHLASDANGVSFVAGVFKDSLSISNQALATKGEQGILINLLSTNGTLSNLHVFKSTTPATLAGISVNDSLICIAGSFSDTLTVQDTILVSNEEQDIFVVLMDKTGNIQWIRSFGGNGRDQAYSVALTNNGEIGITGCFEGLAIFDTQMVQSSGGKDMFVVSLSSNGSVKWLHRIGNISDDFGYAIATNETNELLVSGSYVHSIDFQNESGTYLVLNSTSEFGNSFILKYNSSGVLKAYFSLPGTSEDYGRKIIAGDNDKITLTGSFYGTVALQDLQGFSTEIVSSGEKDIFIMQFEDMCKDFFVEAGQDTSYCAGQSIYLGSPGEHTSFQWLPGGEINQDLEVSSIGTFSVIVTNEYGCIALDSLHVSMNSVPDIFAGNDTVVEAGFPVQLNTAQATNYESIEWGSNGTGYFFDPTLVTASYSLSYHDINLGSVLLTLSGSNVCGTQSDEMNLLIIPEDDGITVYPNPTSGLVNLVCQDDIIIQTVTITTQSGSIVQSNLPVNDYYLQYDLSPYPPDTYLFHLVTNSGEKNKIVNKL